MRGEGAGGPGRRPAGHAGVRSALDQNGLSPVLTQLMERGWVTLLATNGAGIIHDWEFAFQGESSEDVRANVDMGQFGIWEETGFYLNLALVVGAYEGSGYGEAIGKMIEQGGLEIPSAEELLALVRERAGEEPRRAAAALDLLAAIERANCNPAFSRFLIRISSTARRLRPFGSISLLRRTRCLGMT